MNTLLLIGGGSKGAYEVGVWHALKKLKIDIDFIIGTDIGAINGCFFVNNDIFKIYRLWTKNSFYKYFSKNKNDLDDHVVSLEQLSKYFFNKINTNRFYNSYIDFGIFLNDSFVKKSDISEKDLFNSLSMSHTDNIELMIESCLSIGSDSIIVVDLDNNSLKKKIREKYRDMKITFITPDSDYKEGSFLDKNNNKNNMRLGYNDTLKELNRLDGNNYTFKYKDLDKNYKKYGKDFCYVAKRIIGINNKKIINQLEEISIYKRLLKYSFDDKKTINLSLEYLGEIFDIPKYRIYDISMFNHILRTRFLNYDDNEPNFDLNHIKKLDIKTTNRKHMVNVIYNYMQEPVEFYKELNTLCVMFPKEFMGALYLYTIN